MDPTKPAVSKLDTAMTQVWAGPPTGAREIIRALAVLGVDRIGFSIDALSRTTVFVGAESVGDARELLDAVTETRSDVSTLDTSPAGRA